MSWQKDLQTNHKPFDLADAISRMWSSRHGGDLIKSTELFAAIVQNCSLNTAESAKKQSHHLRSLKIAPTDIIDILLFKPSQLRFSHQKAMASTATEDVAVVAEELSCPQHFQLLLQRGINRMAVSNFGSALNEFSLAARQSRTQSEYMICLFNQVICLESMSYDYSAKLCEFETLWERYAGKDEPWAYAANCQLNSLRLRQAVNQGDLARLKELAAIPSLGSQATYYARFLAALPYWNWATDTIKQKLDLDLENQANGYSMQFRIGTIRGRLLRNDFDESILFDDKIERLYLWTWMWLLSSDSELLERILLWWEHVIALAPRFQIGKDELPMLRNAARWLGLFSGYDDQLVRRRVAAVSPAQLEFSPIFDYESHLIDLCTAWRDQNQVIAKDEIRVLQTHNARPIEGFKLPHVLDEQLRKEPSQNVLSSFISKLLTFDSSHTLDADRPGIYVEPLLQRITIHGLNQSEKTIEHEAMVLLLIAAAQRNVIPVFEILERCFDIHNYDPTIHDSKIAHLLVAANRELGAFYSFKRKKSQIVIERNGLGEIHFLGAGNHILQMVEWRERFLSGLKPQSDMTSKIAENPSRDLAPSIPDQEVIAGVWIKRHQLEAVLHVSRATVCRRLSDWLKDGLIDKRGDGRATEYRPSPQLSLQLRSHNQSAAH